MALAFEYTKNHPLETEDEYPYYGYQSSCDYDSSRGLVAAHSYTRVGQGNKNALMQAVARGPVSVAIEADRSAFQSYSGGVITSTSCGTNLDHGVLVVGYDTTANPPYWKVKNSWGTWWGESGYVNIEMVDGQGICGIQMDPVQPVV